MQKPKIDIGYVAELARLELDEEQLERFGRDMDGIVGHIATLSEVDVTGVEPTAHAAALTNVWREDVAGKPYDRETMLANAPALLGGETIRVPQVLPGEGMN